MKKDPEVIRGDGERVVGHACRSCGLLYTTKHYHDSLERAAACCEPQDCPGCKKKMQKHYFLCSDCQKLKRLRAFQSKPDAVWDGSYPVCLFDEDRYFFHPDEVADYLADWHEDADSLDDFPEFEACSKLENRNFDVSELVEWDSDWGEIEDAEEINAHVDEWVEKHVPARYEGNGQRITNRIKELFYGG